MDIEFDFKGDPLGGVISNCKYFTWLFINRLRMIKQAFVSGGLV